MCGGRAHGRERGRAVLLCDAPLGDITYPPLPIDRRLYAPDRKSTQGLSAASDWY